MKAAQIRQNFLTFFESKLHTLVDSAPIVVKNDPTLMFTNAGMNQFKDIFLGNEPAASPRVADTQKCLRVSGKHNDLEEVGVDTYHHTMFEMLGNWSFGDYYKAEAIAWAWELLTEVYKIDKDRLYVTIFEGDEADGLSYDQEARDIWARFISDDRIIPANKKDNFWEMGDVGPCGPCSEIHVDMRPDSERKASSGRDFVNNDHPQVIEIWNLVFMELRRTADGSLLPLTAKHIDTGMGLERLTMVLQNKASTYDTDLFAGLIKFIEDRTGFKYGYSFSKPDIAIRVMCDHIRAVSFAIADGQMPSSGGPGYVIRRILRRAVRYAYSFLNTREAILSPLAEVLVAEMGDFFKELQISRQIIIDVIREEEESFQRTLAKGIELMDQILAKSTNKEISGKVVFELYDTFGFPVDLTALMLSEQDRSYNVDEFEAELEAQKNRSRQASASDTSDWIIVHPSSEPTTFIGYDSLEAKVRLLRYRKVKQKNKELFQLVLDQTPFYAEGGGQVGDQGSLRFGDKTLSIVDTVRENNLIIHVSSNSPEGLSGEAEAKIDISKRQPIARNHSATHLLHHALRQVLGKHVEQKGSLVAKDHLRFDFAHYAKVKPEEMREVEILVNRAIIANTSLWEHRSMPVAEATSLGAMALFGEKYGQEVRVVRFGDSIELCGGTHVKATGEIGFFKILSEGSVASGVRRIEAISGSSAAEYVFDQLDELQEAKGLLKSTDMLPKALKQMLDDQAELTRELEGFKLENAKIVKRRLIESVEQVNGLNFIAARVDLDAAHLRDVAFQIRQEVKDLVLVLGVAQNEKATIAVALGDDVIKNRNLNSGEMVKKLAPLIGGGGGGQAFYATAGGKNPAGLDAVLAQSRALILS